MPVHAIDHSISRKDGVNHNMLVLLNNFWIGLLETAPRLSPDSRVAILVADKLRSQPDATLRGIAAWLGKDLREPTPRGALNWSPEAVRRVIAQGRELGLICCAKPNVKQGCSVRRTASISPEREE